MNNNELNLKECKLICITSVLIFSILILGIAIPCLISEKRNIEKEITLKQMEVYGEVINDK